MTDTKNQRQRVQLGQVYTVVEDRPGFLRGFGEALNLRGACHARPTFYYRGHDIAKTTSLDALSHDWDLVAAYIASAVHGEHNQDESEQE
jgi:hypothetical protein